jgi:hypothetical protein
VFSVKLYHHLLKNITRVFIAEGKARARERRRFIPTCAKAILKKKEDYIIILFHLEIISNRSERERTKINQNWKE